MNKCSIYLRNEELDPSSFYRISQYLQFLSKPYIIHSISTNKEFSRNLQIKNWFSKKIYQAFLYIRMSFRVLFFIFSDSVNKVETIIIQRTILPRHMPFLILLCLRYFYKDKNVIWDFDDNIIQSGEISRKEVNLLVEKSKKIIVTSNFLKETLPKDALGKVILSPTTDLGLSLIYSNSLIKEREQTYDTSVNLIWIGTGGNIRFLNDIIEYLDDAANKLKSKYYKELNLYIICNIPLNTKTHSLNICNIQWTRDVAAEYLKKAHIGIMPLQDTYYTRGKAGFKLVQYMATGLPVIGSNVGYNSSVVDENSGILISPNEESKWHDSIIKMSTNISFWNTMSLGARNKFLKDFNPQRNIELLNNCLNF